MNFFSSMLKFSLSALSTLIVPSSSSTLFPSPLPPPTSSSSFSSYSNQSFPFLFGMEINVIFWTIRGEGDKYCLSTIMKSIWAWRTHQNNLGHLTRRLGTTLWVLLACNHNSYLFSNILSSLKGYSQFSNVFWHCYAQTVLILNLFLCPWINFLYTSSYL